MAHTSAQPSATAVEYESQKHPTPAEKNPAVQKNGNTYTVLKKTSIRSEPNGKALHPLKAGETVTLLEKTDKRWWKVAAGDRVGYLKVSFLKM